MSLRLYQLELLHETLLPEQNKGLEAVQWLRVLLFLLRTGVWFLVTVPASCNCSFRGAALLFQTL